MALKYQLISSGEENKIGSRKNVHCMHLLYQNNFCKNFIFRNYVKSTSAQLVNIYFTFVKKKNFTETAII